MATQEVQGRTLAILQEALQSSSAIVYLSSKAIQRVQGGVKDLNPQWVDNLHKDASTHWQTHVPLARDLRDLLSLDPQAVQVADKVLATHGANNPDANLELSYKAISEVAPAVNYIPIAPAEVKRSSIADNYLRNQPQHQPGHHTFKYDPNKTYQNWSEVKHLKDVKIHEGTHNYTILDEKDPIETEYITPVEGAVPRIDESNARVSNQISSRVSSYIRVTKEYKGESYIIRGRTITPDGTRTRPVIQHEQLNSRPTFPYPESSLTYSQLGEPNAQSAQKSAPSQIKGFSTPYKPNESQIWQNQGQSSTFRYSPTPNNQINYVQPSPQKPHQDPINRNLFEQPQHQIPANSVVPQSRPSQPSIEPAQQNQPHTRPSQHNIQQQTQPATQPQTRPSQHNIDPQNQQQPQPQSQPQQQPQARPSQHNIEPQPQARPSQNTTQQANPSPAPTITHPVPSPHPPAEQVEPPEKSFNDKSRITRGGSPEVVPRQAHNSSVSIFPVGQALINISENPSGAKMNSGEAPQVPAGQNQNKEEPAKNSVESSQQPAHPETQNKTIEEKPTEPPKLPINEIDEQPLVDSYSPTHAEMHGNVEFQRFLKAFEMHPPNNAEIHEHSETHSITLTTDNLTYKEVTTVTTSSITIPPPPPAEGPKQIAQQPQITFTTPRNQTKLPDACRSFFTPPPAIRTLEDAQKVAKVLTTTANSAKAEPSHNRLAVVDSKHIITAGRGATLHGQTEKPLSQAPILGVHSGSHGRIALNEAFSHDLVILEGGAANPRELMRLQGKPMYESWASAEPGLTNLRRIVQPQNDQFVLWLNGMHSLAIVDLHTLKSNEIAEFWKIFSADCFANCVTANASLSHIVGLGQSDNKQTFHRWSEVSDGNGEVSSHQLSELLNCSRLSTYFS